MTDTPPHSGPDTDTTDYPGAPRWVKVTVTILIAVILLLAGLLIAGGGPDGHGPGRHRPGLGETGGDHEPNVPPPAADPVNEAPAPIPPLDDPVVVEVGYRPPTDRRADGPSGGHA